MKQFCALCGLLLFSLIPKVAPAQEFAPYEVSGGYNLRIYTEPNYARIGFNGGYASFADNLLNRVSASVEISGGVRNQGPNGLLSIYSAMIGPQIFPLGHRHKLTPFAHVLFGEAFYRASYPAYGGFPAQVTSDSKFSWEGGGGLDWTHSSHWSFRLIQVDYAETKFLGKQSQTNYRVSVGVVYRFGQK